MTLWDWYLIGLAGSTYIAWLCDVAQDWEDVRTIIVAAMFGPIMVTVAVVATYYRFTAWWARTTP